MTDADLPIVTLKKDSKLYRRGFKQPVKKATGWQWFANEKGYGSADTYGPIISTWVLGKSLRLLDISTSDTRKLIAGLLDIPVHTIDCDEQYSGGAGNRQVHDRFKPLLIRLKLQGTIIREDDADSDCEGADEVVLFASQLSSLTINEVETPPQKGGEQDGGQADDEYTQEMIDGMSREEFDRRRSAHALYGKVEDEEAEEEPNVVATGYTPFNGAEDRLVHLENATPGTFPVHPLMGDTAFPQIAELVEAGNALPVATEEQNPMFAEPAPDDPRRAHARRRFQITHREHVVDHGAYHAFHQNQHDALERLGWNRVRAERTIRDNRRATVIANAVRPTYEGPMTRPRRCDTARQAGSGLAHHVGASAEQQVLAGTGQIPPAPGYHRMPTGEIMADGQSGGWMPAFAKNDPDRAGDNPAPYWYMGAGNPMDGQVPSNKADEIAMDHDYEYGSATSFADVRRADDKFVERMRHQPGIWPAVAAFAIHAKGNLEAGLERTMGDRIYPNAAMLAENAKMASLPHPTADNLRAASKAALNHRTGKTPETRAPLRYVGPLTATVVWGQGLSQLRRLQQLIGPTGDVSTAQIAAQIRRGDGFYGGTRREISAAMAAHTSFRGQQQLYLVSSQLDEQWGYLSLLSVSRRLARQFLKVCYTRHARGLSYGAALELVARAKPERPVDNAIDLLAYFLSQA